MPFCPVITRLLLVLKNLLKRIIHVLLDCGDTCKSGTYIIKAIMMPCVLRFEYLKLICGNWEAFELVALSFNFYIVP